MNTSDEITKHMKGLQDSVNKLIDGGLTKEVINQMTPEQREMIEKSKNLFDMGEGSLEDKLNELTKMAKDVTSTIR